MNIVSRITKSVAAVILVMFLDASVAVAQSGVSLSGRVFADYSYVIASPDKEAEGDNGFGYRRVYMTANYTISDRFSGRFRLEANDGSTNAQGKNAPFVKDLYLKWKGALGEGHDVTMGVSSPRSFLVSQAHWGHRSLEKTILDRAGVIKSRDMGITASGPLTSSGSVRYGLMLANNNNVNGENDRNKRVYGQLEFYPEGRFHFTVGGDYAAMDDGSAFTLHGFAGYQGEGFRVGAEGFFHPRSFDNLEDNDTKIGGTLFVIAEVSEKNTAIFRIDRVEWDLLGVTTSEIWALAGYTFHLEKNIHLTPNIIYSKYRDQDDPFINGRMTLYYKF